MMLLLVALIAFLNDCPGLGAIALFLWLIA